jgi:hypothetical protein
MHIFKGFEDQSDTYHDTLVSCPLIEKFSAIEEERKSLAVATLLFLPSLC